MRKSVLLFLVFLPCFLFSQQWHAYSDSIIFNYKKNNIEKAKHYIKLAEEEINKSKLIKDTIYADYLYRKGVVKSSLGDYDSTLLKQALDIWESSQKKNYLKIMKINYFLGGNYFLIGNQSQNKVDYDTSYKYFEKNW
jgi:predicted translin family RNA/ssDNA-binding protein